MSEFFLTGANAGEILKWAALIIVNIPVYFLLGWIIFKDWDDFFDGLRFIVTPDIVSAFRGDYWDDRWASIKLSLWAFACISCVIGEVYLLTGKLVITM